METVEIIIYIVIALALGGLVILFIGGWDAGATFESMKSIFRPEPDDQYEKITADKFARTALQTWEACGLGSADLNKTVYVTEGLVNKTGLFASVKQANLCKSLQSQSLGCGAREDVPDFERQAPVILQLRCDAATRTLIIT